MDHNRYILYHFKKYSFPKFVYHFRVYIYFKNLLVVIQESLSSTLNEISFKMVTQYYKMRWAKLNSFSLPKIKMNIKNLPQ